MSFVFGLLFISSVVAWIAGVVLVLRNRPVPHRRCRSCGYRLFGDVPVRCSECGAILTGDAVVEAGKARKNPRQAAVALALIVLGVLAAIASMLATFVAVAAAR